MKKIGTILLIDDDSICTYFNRQLLEGLQMIDHIICINDGQEAIEYLEKAYASSVNVTASQPDLIFLDLNMPGFGGFQLLEQLNQMWEKEILKVERVVILTTSMQPVDQDRATSYNVFDFLGKPLTGTKVKKVLDRFLQTHQLHSKTQSEEHNPGVIKNRSPAGRSGRKGLDVNQELDEN